MIDLDELPSPTKPPEQEPISSGHLQAQAHPSQLNIDLVRMARHAFPNVSPAFIDLLLKQGKTLGTQASNGNSSLSPNEQRSQAFFVQPKASTQVLDIEGDTSETTSVNSTPSNSTDAAEKCQTVRTLLTNTPSSQEKSEIQSSSPPIVLEVSMESDQLDNLAQGETSDISSSPTPPIVLDVLLASDQLENAAPEETDADSSLPTPPVAQEQTTPSDQQVNPATQEKLNVSSSPTPPTVKELQNSSSHQGKTGKTG